MWIVVFVLIAVAGLALIGLLAWRLVRKAGALLGEVSGVLDELSTVENLAAGVRLPDESPARSDDDPVRSRTQPAHGASQSGSGLRDVG